MRRCFARWAVLLCLGLLLSTHLSFAQVVLDAPITGSGGGAQTTSRYLLRGADASLPNAQNLGVLGDGPLVNTVSGGIATLSIAVTTGSGAQVLAVAPGLDTPSLGTTPLTTTYPNDLTTGTTAKFLVKQNGSSPAQGVKASTADTGIVGVCISGCGTTGTAEIATRGQTTCTFENTATANHLVGVGTTTAGACKDLGSGNTSDVDKSLQIIGRALTSGVAGDRLIQLFGPGHYGYGGIGGGSVTTVNPGTDTGTVTNFGTFGFTNQSTTPTLTVNLTQAPAHTFFGNNTGSTAAPNYLRLACADLSNAGTGCAGVSVPSNLTLTNPASAATFTLLGGKTFTVNQTLTLDGTSGSTLNMGAGGTLGTAAYTATTAYEVPLTFSTGLTRTTNTVTVNTTQNIVKLSNLTTNGLIHTTNSDGTLNALANVAAGQVLVSGGVGAAPGWTANPSVTSLTLGEADQNLLFGSIYKLGPLTSDINRFHLTRVTSGFLSLRFISGSTVSDVDYNLWNSNGTRTGTLWLNLSNTALRILSTENITLEPITGKNVGIGTFTFGTNAAGVFALKQGTCGTTSPADQIELCALDTDGAGTTGLRLRDEAGFLYTWSNGLIRIGGTSSSFPALKRSASLVQVRLADDSDDATLNAKTLRTGCFAIASLPTGVTGDRACINDQVTACPILGGTFTAGGAVVCSAFYNGTAWVHE